MIRIKKVAGNTKSGIEQDMHLQMLIMQISLMLQPSRGKTESTMAPGQRRTMCIIAMHGQITQQDLLEEQDIAPATLSEFLGKLEHKGYITRKKSESDRRVWVIELTETGVAVARSFIEEDHAFAKKAFSGMTSEEKQQLNDLLEDVIDNWHKTITH